MSKKDENLQGSAETAPTRLTTYEHLLEAYKQLARERGVNDPFTAELRTIIHRQYKHHGQQGILNANRQMREEKATVTAATHVTETEDGTGQPRMVRFIHPAQLARRAAPASAKKAAVQPPTPAEDENDEGSGRLARSAARVQRGATEAQKPQPATPPSAPRNAPSPPAEERDENGDAVGEDDQVQGKPVAKNSPLTAEEIDRVRTMKARAVVSEFGEGRILATLRAYGVDEDETPANPAQMASMLKQKI